jgi:predicted ABC-type ATPase
VPVLTLIAGPNGSGKSTLTRFVGFEGREHLIDPDAVARDINPSNPVAAAIEAGRQVSMRIREYLLSGTSFAVETTLSGRSIMTLMAEARSRGYEIDLAFIALESPDESIARIQTRADRGGHFIPDVDVKRRYTRSLANLTEAIRLADTARIYDNSGDQHRAILVAKFGIVVWKTTPLPRWAEFLNILEQNI